MAKPAPVTDQSFQTDVLNADKPVLVDFWAEWCGPCRMIAPLLEQLNDEHGDKLKIVKLNVDENPGAASQFGVMSIPTMILFKDGQQVDRLVGYMPKQALTSKLGKHVPLS
jgi:thioredoxin 1